jgi:hypothetical protein
VGNGGGACQGAVHILWTRNRARQGESEERPRERPGWMGHAASTTSGMNLCICNFHPVQVYASEARDRRAALRRRSRQRVSFFRFQS